MKKKITIILVLIIAVVIAIGTRYYKLGEAPKGLYLDEAGQGYSAYSILKTGKDEFGKSFPIVFRSFTDFKTPIYIYLIVPLIPIFGLSSYAVRFPSFFFSILTIPVLYILITELGKKIDWKIGLIASILLAISPWHILFGRTNFECNVALFFFLSGCLLFYKSLKRPWLLVFSALFFAIAIPAYHAQRIVTPLMLIILFIRHRKTLLSKSHFKYLIVGGLIGLVISLPTLSVVNTPGFLARANGLNIFSGNHQSAGYLENYKGMFSFIVNGRWFLSIQEFASLYVSYFSPRNIFILGDSGPRSSFPELATFFVWQVPFYIYGLYKLVRSKELGEFKFFLISLLLVSPIPAALTRDPYSTIRSLQMVVPLTIIIALSISEVFNKLRHKNSQIAFCLVSILLIAYSIGKLYSSVIVLNEHYRGVYWNYGWEEAANVIKSFGPNAPVIVDNSRDEPYIQLVFFLQADPLAFQKENFEVTPDEYYTNMQRNKDKKIGRLITRPIDWEHDLNDEEYMVGDELAISLQQIQEHKLTLIKEIKYPDGSVALRIVKTNPKLLSRK